MGHNYPWPATAATISLFPDDAALAAGLRRGDARAVEQVVQQYAPVLYRFAVYQLQDAILAEDIVAEVLARMIEKIDGYVPGPIPFKAWLFRIARNLIADHYRARKRRPQISFDAWQDAHPGAEPAGTDAATEWLPDREALRTGLAALTAEQREVIVLHLVDGWELPEVAQRLDRSVPSVKGLYYRGLGSLRRLLAADAPPAAALPRAPGLTLCPVA